ncbi:hypothetical protein AS594_08755 [Streptomyces agglomeratus]|uniref:Uncharacterized protein n=1 Tax=Streptomyces agglomeratus TaxID=285458 RepID=A0A1E5P4U2_9ACTN|nr:hypothetical protein AS594_08755 [Streptomyces agglomeratus]
MYMSAIRPARRFKIPKPSEIRCGHTTTRCSRSSARTITPARSRRSDPKSNGRPTRSETISPAAVCGSACPETSIEKGCQSPSSRNTCRRPSSSSRKLTNSVRASATVLRIAEMSSVRDTSPSICHKARPLFGTSGDMA